MTATATLTMPEVEQVSFNALDRCDRCGAQAYHKAYREGFAELLFCNHHGEKHRDALLGGGWEVVSDQLGIDNLRQQPG